jgi:hypothetical protein
MLTRNCCRSHDLSTSDISGPAQFLRKPANHLKCSNCVAAVMRTFLQADSSIGESRGVREASATLSTRARRWPAHLEHWDFPNFTPLFTHESNITGAQDVNFCHVLQRTTIRR